MYVDPAVVRRKVDRELLEYAESAERYRSRGIWLQEYRFPQLLFVFASREAKPAPIVPFGVLMDLSNYDVDPPSIRFVNPFTSKPYVRSELVTRMPRQQGNAMVEMIQGWHDQDIPFLCLRGVREYHKNPAHTGDHWFLHRATGAGRIARLVDLIAQFGSEPLTLAMQLQLSVQTKMPVPVPIPAQGPTA